MLCRIPTTCYRLVLMLGSICLIALLAPPHARAARQHLRRYPYLTDVVGRYATINWATDRSADVGLVRWGKADSESCTAHATPAVKTNLVVNDVEEYQWKALLTLVPDARYCYRVYLGSDPAVDLLGTDPAPQFWTQVPAGSTAAFSFAVFGDWGATDAAGTNPHQTNVLRQIAASSARFALTPGDNANPSGTQKNYGDLIQAGPDLSAVFGPAFWPAVGASLPLFPALGNHGFSVPDVNHPHLLNWPQDRAVATSGGRYARERYCCPDDTEPKDYPSAWYAFDAGLARFYVLEAAWADTDDGKDASYENDYAYHWTPGRAEYQWLRHDLEAHPRALKFAFFHFPLYSDDNTEPSDTFLHGPDSLEGLLNRYGVNMVFNGHAHIYQRNQLPPPNGLITYVTGGGGDRLKQVGQKGCSAHDAYAIGWSSISGRGSACGAAPLPQAPEEVFHFLLVRVEGTSVTVIPTDELGRTFDVQTYHFAGKPDQQAPTTPAALTVQAADVGTVYLRWSPATDDTGVAGYTIYRDGMLLDTVGPTTQSYTDASVTHATTYHYTIDAFDSLGHHSAPAGPAIATTPERSFTFIANIVR